MTDKLTDNDKQRIEQVKNEVALKNGWNDWDSLVIWHRESGLLSELWEYIDEVAEYATIYEREKQAKPILLTDALKEASTLLLDGDEGYKLQRVAELLQQVAELTKENERLKEWQESATGVLNKWYKCSEFLAEKSLVTLSDNYSEKCLEVLKSLTEQVEKLKEIGDENIVLTEKTIKAVNKASVLIIEVERLREERKEMVEALRRISTWREFLLYAPEKFQEQVKALLSEKK